jgi:hypothetical protein
MEEYDKIKNKILEIIRDILSDHDSQSKVFKIINRKLF